MNRPGIWIFGSVKQEDRQMGLGVVVEYANQRGEPNGWTAGRHDPGTTRSSATTGPCRSPTIVSSFCLRKSPADAAATIAGRSTAVPGQSTQQLLTTETGKRYRLAMTNKSGDNHPVHLHRHTFEVTKVGDKKTSGVMKDTINMTRFSSVEIDFVANDPGPSLLHCHHQDHQDEGFMGLVTYL